MLDLIHAVRAAVSRHRYDLALAAGFAVICALLAIAGFERVSPYISHYSTWDYWFDGDSPGVADQMLRRWSGDHHRTSHHPLFSLFVSTPVQAMQFLGLGQAAALGTVVATAAAAWVAAVFSCLRLLGIRRSDAAVFTTLAMASASFVFWFPIPETFALGALSIAVTLVVAASWERGWRAPFWVLVLVSLLALSFTETNWMVALAMLAVLVGWRRGAAVATVSVLLCGLLWGAQKILYPLTDLPFPLSMTDQSLYLLNDEAIGWVAKLRVFFLHSVVLPDFMSPYGFRLNVQRTPIGGGNLLSMLAVSLWIVLLGLAAWSTAHLWRRPAVRILVLALAGQLVLHLLYGVETFLYSAHYTPLLVVATGLTAMTRLRAVAVPLAAVVALGAAVGNIDKYDAAADGLRARYERERAFTARLAQRTLPQDLLVCGREAAAAHGEVEALEGAPSGEAAADIVRADDPDTCAFAFADLQVDRRGWILPYEQWSVATVEAMHRQGARYFVSRYRFGIREKTMFFAEMRGRYHVIDHEPDWVLYELSP